ncbi:hypothetical protein BgiMline_015129 [Biomphalaria glabrata]|nr:hypothetical protein BgiMline_022239 [Biomphalaria glabrata]
MNSKEREIKLKDIVEVIQETEVNGKGIHILTIRELLLKRKKVPTDVVLEELRTVINQGIKQKSIFRIYKYRGLQSLRGHATRSTSSVSIRPLKKKRKVEKNIKPEQRLSNFTNLEIVITYGSPVKKIQNFVIANEPLIVLYAGCGGQINGNALKLEMINDMSSIEINNEQSESLRDILSKLSDGIKIRCHAGNVFISNSSGIDIIIDSNMCTNRRVKHATEQAIEEEVQVFDFKSFIVALNEYKEAQAIVPPKHEIIINFHRSPSTTYRVDLFIQLLKVSITVTKAYQELHRILTSNN